MRFLGIDHGSSYLGLAVGDNESYLSLPFDTIAEKDTREQLAQVEQIILDENIDAIVVGLPLSMDGGSSAQTESTLSFINGLSGLVSIPVHREDERLSSKLGEQLKKDSPGGKFDDHALAAASILQVYLDRLKNDV